METKKAKKFSIAMFLVAFALMIAAVFAMPAVVFAEPAPKSTSANLTINYSLADYTIASDSNGEYIIIPSVNTGAKIEATTANGAKKKATIDSTDVTQPKLYLVGNVSSYDVVYSFENSDGNVATETININLEQQDSSFKFETNSKEIIPSTVQQSVGNTITFPYPFVYVGEESDTPINVNAATGRPEDVTGLSVTLTSPRGTNVTENFVKNSNGYYEYKITDATELGKYTVRYTYKTATAQTVIKTFNFTVKDGAVEQAIKIDKFNASLPSAMALFVETELPKPVVVNTKNSGVEVSVFSTLYLQFTPSKAEDADKATTYTNDIEKKGVDGYTYESSLNEFKFTPTVAGTFTVTYNVVDFFGNTAETSSAVNAITARKTAESGSGYIVEAYADFDAEKALIESGDYKTAEYKIPSKVTVVNASAEDISTEEVWNLPAIFGIDKLTTNSADLTYERIVRYTNSNNTSIKISFLSSGSEQPSNAIYQSSGTYKASANETIPFRFTEEADYTVEYVVRDSANNTLFDKTYTVSAQKDYSDAREPTVKFEGLSTTTVAAGKVLKFKVTGLDTISDTDSTVADSRLNMAVTAQVGTDPEETLFADSNGYYTYDTKDLENGEILVIKAVATDDYGNATTSNNTKTITIKKVTGANVPTATDFDFDTNNTHDQYWVIDSETLKSVLSGTTVKLPEVTFTDANGNNNLSVKVTAKVGSTIVYQSAANSGNTTSVSLGNETFVVSRSGDYVVNYVATDAAGNKLVKSFVFTVIGPEKTIINLGSFDSNYEYGTEIDIRNLSVILQTNAGSENITDDCTLITNISSTATDAEIKAAAQTAAASGQAILVQIIGDYELTDDESIIKAGQNGSVTINYWAVGNWTDVDEFNRNFTETAKSVNFTVKDTTKPTIIVDEALIEDVVPYDSKKTGKYDNMIKIADMQKVWDLSGIEDGSIKITAKYNSSTKDAEIIVLGGSFTDGNDVFYVGNNKVTIENVEYEFDADAKTLTSGGTTYTLDANDKVTINSVEYTFAEETEYYGYFKANANGVVTVTYSATDTMGNTQTKTYTITVGDVTPPEINATAVKTAVENAKYQKGNTVTINLKDDLKIIDDVSSISYESVKVTVTRDGEAVDVDTSDATKAVFEVSEYGTYTISFDVKDGAGYSAETATVQFTVSNNTNSKTVSSTTVWGTVLIVVILVALGVIIFLFAKPSKSKQTVKLTENKKDEKDNKNDKIEV